MKYNVECINCGIVVSICGSATTQNKTLNPSNDGYSYVQCPECGNNVFKRSQCDPNRIKQKGLDISIGVWFVWPLCGVILEKYYGFAIIMWKVH